MTFLSHQEEQLKNMIGRGVAREMRRRSFLLQSAAAVALSLSSSALVTASSHPLAFASNVFLGRRSSVRIMSSPTTPVANGTVEKSTILPCQEGSHNSAKVVVTPDFDRSNFRSRLEATVASCREQQKSSIWIEVPMSCAALIEDMVDCGLRFHHAEGETASLSLWLKDTECKIPEYATHHVVSENERLYVTFWFE